MFCSAFQLIKYFFQDALIDQSRSTLILSPKLDKLKKALQLFSEKTSNPKEIKSSPYKTNAIPASPKSM